jgi:serine/threonine protein kinase
VADPVEQKVETTRLGSYEIVRKLARGGMAELFLARSVGPEGFEKLVVLKKILPRNAENPRFVQLFLDEAKLAGSLTHPHIVQTYDMGRVGNDYFFAMEFVHGQDLRSILRRSERTQRKVPIDVAVQIARNVASALHYAHERRRGDGTLVDIVHRDVSPSNILVSYDGGIKLADFGVAKASSSSARTRTGTLKGKVGYMSPEQARGAPIDRRSDIFSLGVVLWELVAVRRLFKSDNDLATIQSIINGDTPPLEKFRPDCPPELEKIILRALAKDPEVRYQTAQAFQRDLEELAREAKLNQSSIAVGAYLAELFETEIAAWKETLALGGTVTDFVVASNDPGTPASGSEVSIEDPSFIDAEEAHEEEPEEEDEEEHSEMPELAPRAGSISVDAELEATMIGAPPVMSDSVVFKPPPDVFDQVPTTVQISPFAEEQGTVPLRVQRFADESVTVPRTQPLDNSPMDMPDSQVAARTSVFVNPMTPSQGVPTMPTPMSGMPIRPKPHSTPQPYMSGYASLPPGTTFENVDLSPLPRRWLVIGGIVVGAVVVFAIILAIASGGSPSEDETVTPDAAATPVPEPKPAPAVVPTQKAVVKPAPVAPAPASTPEPAAVPDDAAVAEPPPVAPKPTAKKPIKKPTK